MLTLIQRQYMTEVLGASLDSLLRAAKAAAVTSPVPESREAAELTAEIPILVIAPNLTVDERALLEKILASVKLTDVPIVERLTQDLHPRHILAFGEGAQAGQGTTLWTFPELRRMLAGNDAAEVTALKKETWARLQEFQREFTR